MNWGKQLRKLVKMQNFKGGSQTTLSCARSLLTQGSLIWLQFPNSQVTKNPGSLKHYMTPSVKTQKAMCNYLQDTASRANESVGSGDQDLPALHAIDSLQDMPSVPALEPSQTVSFNTSNFHAVETQPCQIQLSQNAQSHFALRAVETRPCQTQIGQNTASNLATKCLLQCSNVTEQFLLEPVE